MAMDETDVNLRSYFSRLPIEKLAEYVPTWTDDKVIEWDGNFRDDGTLFLTCSERDVDIEEYRTALPELGKVYREVMGRNFGAMALVQVNSLVEKEARLEIETTAVIPD